MTEFRDDFSSRPFDLVLTVNVLSQDPVTNTSTLSCALDIVRTGAYQSFASSGNTWSASIDGNALGPAAFSFDFRNYSSLRLYTWTVTATHDAGGNKTVAVSASVTASVIGSAAVSSSMVLPQIIQPPTAPTIGTVTRLSDTSLSVPWTPNPASGKPYYGQSVWVSVDGGALTFVANVTGTATSYGYTASANRKYTFVVKASNAAGTTASAVSNIIITTPNPLVSLSAALISSGTIRLTLPVRPTVHTDAQVVITETHDAGATWNAKTTIAMSALSTSTTTTWDDTSATTSGTVQYRAVVQTTSGTQGTLSSTYTTSNTLVLNTPPLAPTGITPSGSVDASRPIRIGWTHTPSSDGATQSSRKIEYSTNGGSTWTSIVAGNTAVAYHDWTPTLGSFTAGDTILLRVATAGSQAGTYGAWSASQSITLYGSLAVTLTAGYPATTHLGGPMTVAWTSSATWGTATQTQYQVTVTDQATGQVVYDTGSVSGTNLSHDVPSSVQVNSHVYTVAVVLVDNHQITSATAARTVTMDFLAPGPVDSTWSYDDQAGALTFYPVFSPESSSAFDDTTRWTVERSLDGETWTLIGDVLGELPITDALVRLNTESWYRTVGYTALGIAGDATVFTVTATDVVSKWGWLNYGAGFQSYVRFGWAQTVEVSTGRASDAFEVESNDPDNYPVGVFGPSLSEKYSVSGKLLSGAGIDASLASASASDMMVLSKIADGCIFRDARGTWIPARVTDMKVSPNPAKPGPDEAGVSFTVERIAS